MIKAGLLVLVTLGLLVLAITNIWLLVDAVREHRRVREIEARVARLRGERA